tara:strand:+ start:592 stop:843 length:252 start_codon:yes stop_codon:yes gene_type:complete
MTRKHFKELASIIYQNNVDVDLLKAIIKFCKSQNSNFDVYRFVDACGFTITKDGNYKRVHREITTILNDDMEYQFRSPDLFKM